jgi:ubiquinol-cytochrome c reductase iron-sulfur subunit
MPGTPGLGGGFRYKAQRMLSAVQRFRCIDLHAMREMPKPEPPPETRRDVIVTAAQGFAAVGVAMAAWPLVSSLGASSDVLASANPLDVDLSHLTPSAQTVVQWRGLPIFIAQRTPQELNILQLTKDTSLLRDPDSNEPQQPSYAKNWHRSIKPDYLVLVGI